jgi:hypothetical protein
MLDPPTVLHRSRVGARERFAHDEEAVAMELVEVGR